MLHMCIQSRLELLKSRFKDGLKGKVRLFHEDWVIRRRARVRDGEVDEKVEQGREEEEGRNEREKASLRSVTTYVVRKIPQFDDIDVSK